MVSGGRTAPASAGAAVGAGVPDGCQVMAGGGGAAGPAPLIRHQAPLAGARTRRGSRSVIMYIYIHYNTANMIPASRSVPVM
jgi:hypothetical protein